MKIPNLYPHNMILQSEAQRAEARPSGRPSLCEVRGAARERGGIPPIKPKNEKPTLRLAPHLTSFPRRRESSRYDKVSEDVPDFAFFIYGSATGLDSRLRGNDGG